VLRKERRRGQDFDWSEPVQWDARIDHGLALVHQLRGDNVAARALLERAIMRASQSGLLAETPAMYAALAIVLRRERLRDESYRAALTGLRVCRSLSRASDGARDDVARLLLGVAAAQFGRERWVATERTYRQVLRVIGEQGNPDLLGRALNGIGATHLERRNFRRAREMFLRALRVKDRAGDLQQLAVGYSNLAAVACAMGEHAEARKQARRAIGLAEKIQARSDLADMYRHLATAQAGTGALEDALASGRTALAAALEAAPLYVADVASTFTRVCVQASAADAPAVRHRARAEARALLAIFAARFTDGDLAVRAEECRALLAPILDSGEPR
jgi:tetratricopeptide (TPR) repeat protein